MENNEKNSEELTELSLTQLEERQRRLEADLASVKNEFNKRALEFIAKLNKTMPAGLKKLGLFIVGGAYYLPEWMCQGKLLVKYGFLCKDPDYEKVFDKGDRKMKPAVSSAIDEWINSLGYKIGKLEGGPSYFIIPYENFEEGDREILNISEDVKDVATAEIIKT